MKDESCKQQIKEEMLLIEKVKQEVQKSRASDIWNDSCELKINPAGGSSLGFQEDILKEKRYREERTSLLGENFMAHKYPDEARRYNWDDNH